MLKIGGIEGIASLTKNHVQEDDLILDKNKSIGTNLVDAQKFASVEK
jgi:hypothetical protein